MFFYQSRDFVKSYDVICFFLDNVYSFKYKDNCLFVHKKHFFN